MRTGNCTVQQGLTSEATTIVKQAVTLARRRGHAQVTPLHVASTMLAATNGLLRTACLQSHSHPLQCKALELCFNVALNRLPASSGSPMLAAPHSQCPSISNALVAAFKRAQAHQRRGSIENQQQPLLAVKIESEQLIISILDDPSVSRVMREAGFSSTQVKSNVEQAVSLEICSQNPPSVSIKSKDNNNNGNSNGNNSNNLTLSHSQPSCQVGDNIGKSLVSSDPIRAEDIASVIDSLTNPRKRSTVVVGESPASLEGVVKGVMDKVEKEDPGEALKDLKFICVSLSSFGHFSRVDVEQKIEEFKSVAMNSLSKRFILYLGDLKWIFEYRDNSSQQARVHSYCPVEHMILEIGKLVGGVAENGRFSIMAIATFQTYMRCKNGHPSLETVWGIHPLTIPACSLRLSLITDSGLEANQSTNKKVDNVPSWLLLECGKEKQPPCSAQPSVHFVTEVGSLQSGSTCNSDSSPSSLPAWLQQCKNQHNGITTSDQNCVPVGDLCKRWNSMCSSINKPSHTSEKTLTFSPISPSSSTSGYSYDHQLPNLQQNHHFWISESSGNKPNELTLRMYIPEHQDSKQPFSLSNPDSNPNSNSSSDVMDTEYVSKFRELNSENLKTLCGALEKNVPWQSDIIPEIASSILQCRSGMLKRKRKEKNSEAKEETWLFFQGTDVDAKEKIARELAKLVFDSHSNFISISLSSFSSTRAHSTEDSRNKRPRDEQSCSYIERFADAVASNPHRVFLIEDIEQADYFSQKAFKRAIERGRIADSKGQEVGFSDAIIILSCDSFSSRSRTCSPRVQQKYSHEDQNDATLEESINPNSVSLDMNISIDDEDQSVDDIGLLESVDRRIVFKFQESRNKNLECKPLKNI